MDKVHRCRVSTVCPLASTFACHCFQVEHNELCLVWKLAVGLILTFRTPAISGFYRHNRPQKYTLMSVARWTAVSSLVFKTIQPFSEVKCLFCTWQITDEHMSSVIIVRTRTSEDFLLVLFLVLGLHVALTVTSTAAPAAAAAAARARAAVARGAAALGAAGGARTAAARRRALARVVSARTTRRAARGLAAAPTALTRDAIVLFGSIFLFLLVALLFLSALCVILFACNTITVTLKVLSTRDRRPESVRFATDTHGLPSRRHVRVCMCPGLQHGHSYKNPTATCVHTNTHTKHHCQLHKARGRTTGNAPLKSKQMGFHADPLQFIFLPLLYLTPSFLPKSPSISSTKLSICSCVCLRAPLLLKSNPAQGLCDIPEFFSSAPKLNSSSSSSSSSPGGSSIVMRASCSCTESKIPRHVKDRSCGKLWARHLTNLSS